MYGGGGYERRTSDSLGYDVGCSKQRPAVVVSGAFGFGLAVVENAGWWLDVVVVGGKVRREVVGLGAEGERRGGAAAAAPAAARLVPFNR